MKLTSELSSLTLVTTATALMWIPYVVGRISTHGVWAATGNPGPGYPIDPPWVDRARRAHLNAIENLAVFAPLVLAAAIAGVSTPATVIAAHVYAFARLLHYPIYVAGVPLLRTLAFFVGACASLFIAVVLLRSAT